LIQSDIVRVTYTEEFEVSLADVKEVEIAILGIFNGKRVCSIVNLNKRYLNIARDAQEYMAKDAVLIKHIKGSAIVANALPNQLLIRFFMKRFEPKYPLKVFKTEEEAIHWFRILR
jgi:hypothetical protein